MCIRKELALARTQFFFRNEENVRIDVKGEPNKGKKILFTLGRRGGRREER